MELSLRTARRETRRSGPSVPPVKWDGTAPILGSTRHTAVTESVKEPSNVRLYALTMLRVRLVGEVEAEVDGESRTLPSGRPLSLLGWLALNPGLHPRSDIAPRFWPDVLDESARASLRSALWALRRSLGVVQGSFNQIAGRK